MPIEGRRRRRWAAKAGRLAAGMVALVLAGCAPADEPTTAGVETQSPTPSPTASPSPEPAPDLPEGVPAEAQPAVVERIVDGDTIWVRVDQPGGPLTAGASHQIRLLQIDTPETKHPSKPVQCWGPEATAFAQQQLPVGSTVYLVADQEDTDRFGRFLRHVWTADGRFFNEEAVRQGMARAVLYEPNDRFIEQIRTAEAEARQSNRGMWGPPCDYDAPAPPPPPPPPPPSPPPPPPQPEPAPQPGNCDPSYPEVCMPPPPPDLDCSDIAHRGFAVVGADPHGFDRDGDGVGCES